MSMTPDLSILIPARNEMFLAKTIENILENIRGDTEIIVVLDGQWAEPPIEDHERVHLIYHSESIGQRAATNEAARMSEAKYLMKMDAHCSVDEGFDVKMMDEMQDDWTMVPLMKNLHAFDWVCQDCGNRIYQGPTPETCKECGSLFSKGAFKRDVVWIAKPSPNSTSYRFNKDLQFKYFGEYKRQQKGDIVETMSLQGSCFMVTQDKYWELELCDESWGSWGQQGTEVALKTWLSGGRVVCNKKTWYAHLFRTRKGFTWPYPPPGKSQRNARKLSKDIFLNDKWDKAVHPLSWLIGKFAPIPDWEEHVSRNNRSKGIIYYTDNRLDEYIMKACQAQLQQASNGREITSVSLKKLHRFGRNTVLDLERGYLTMFKQILIGLEKSSADVVFFCEHDVLYHPSHFDFTPPRDDCYWYNENTWKVDAETGHALYYVCRQTSGLCADRLFLLDHYRKRVEHTEAKLKEHGESYEYRKWIRKQGFEPGTHGRGERVDDFKADSWMSEYPNIDIRHDKNLTPSRWRQDQFRNQRFCQGWLEDNSVPGWGKTEDRFDEILSEVAHDMKG